MPRGTMLPPTACFMLPTPAPVARFRRRAVAPAPNTSMYAVRGRQDRPHDQDMARRSRDEGSRLGVRATRGGCIVFGSGVGQYAHATRGCSAKVVKRTPA